MKVALFVGDHKGDTLLVRAGWAMTRKVQKGPFGIITHTENIHEEHGDGSVTIASSSIRDGGVRAKRVTLNPANWWIADVPQWNVNGSSTLLDCTLGQKYDIRGAIATVFLGSEDNTRWFCNEWCGTPFLKGASYLSPSQFGAVAMSLGQDVTHDFFEARRV